MRIFKSSLLSACVIFSTSYAGIAFAADGAQTTAKSPAPASSNDGSSPYQFSLLYTGEDWENASGGLKTGNSYMNNIDAKLSVDTGKAFGWTGGQFVLEGWYENALSTGRKYTGTLNQQSPIDANWNTSMLRLYQAYYDQNFVSTGTDVRFGIYDLETEFSTTKPMSLFLSKNLTWNTAYDQSGTMPQNGNVGPGNYPYTPLALRVHQDITKEWSVQVAVADGIADRPVKQEYNGIYFDHQDGLNFIGEVDYEPSKHTKIMAGTWALTAKLPTNNQGNPYTYGQGGAYIGGATRLYSYDEKRGLDAFLTLGYSDPIATNVMESLNGGLVYTGLFDARPHDKIGVSFNVSIDPDSYRRNLISQGYANPSSHETMLEGTYRARLTDWLTVQPDVQYTINPNYGFDGNNPGKPLKNDLVVGMHFEIGHLFNL